MSREGWYKMIKLSTVVVKYYDCIRDVVHEEKIEQVHDISILNNSVCIQYVDECAYYRNKVFKIDSFFSMFTV